MGEITIRKALDDYKTVYMAYRNFAERTRVEYQNDLEDLLEFLQRLGIKSVQDIQLPQIERYLAELDRRGMAGSTRKRKVVSIRSFVWFLFRDQYIATNLAKRLIPPFAEAKSPRYLTKFEVERLLAACSQNPRDFALIQLLLQTGIKLSELIRVTVNDVELACGLHPDENDNGYLRLVGGERQKARLLPLNMKACIALETYIKSRQSMNSTVLFINRFGQPLSARGVEKVVKNIWGKLALIMRAYKAFVTRLAYILLRKAQLWR